jgi:hypothetical protein
LFFHFLFFLKHQKKQTQFQKKQKDNELGPEGGMLIAEALKINSSIQHLSFWSNILCFIFPFLNTNSQKQNQFQKQKAINLDQKEARHLQKH